MTDPQQQAMPPLLPCPFCGAGEHQIRENGRMWSGMRYSDPVSVTVHHWCERPDGQPQSHVTITGRDAASAVELWNRRAASAPSREAPDQESADDAATMDRMADLLTRTANSLRGDPGPLRRWSWHDLPERASAAIAAIDVMTRAARKLASAPDWNPIDTAPPREVVAVYWVDREGEERHDLDFWDEGVWSGWHDHAEHTEIIGGHGVPYAAPYTHWKRLGAPSSPSVAAEELGHG